MQIQNEIDPQSLRTARTLLASQSFVPMSPATLDEAGRPCLCAAALLASAGLRDKVSPFRAHKFESELATTKEKRLVYDAYAELGWSRALCNEMMDRNDAAAPEVRKQTVACLFEDLTKS